MVFKSPIQMEFPAMAPQLKPEERDVITQRRAAGVTSALNCIEMNGPSGVKCSATRSPAFIVLHRLKNSRIVSDVRAALAVAR